MSGPFPLTEDASQRWLAAVDPRLKLVWIAALSLLSVLVDSTEALAVLFAAGALPLVGLRLRARAWLAIGGVVLTIAWSTLLSQAIFYTGKPRTALFTIVPEFTFGSWQFPGVKFYLEGAKYGLVQSLRFSGVSLAGIAVCLSTSPDRLLGGLVRLRVPMGIAFMAMTALRFLPAMLDEWSTVRRARRLRGYRARRFGPANWYHVSRDELQLLLPVLAAALRRAASLATAAESRGFSPTAERTFYPELRMKAGEMLLVALLCAVCVIVLLTKLAVYSRPGWLGAFPAFESFLNKFASWL
ncbi:MAG TPA: energy-coupling factor transporter transmembrane component T [Pirellulales bacterium]|nr:energy-coupling factor transporter transmembrane component T [Pirellulales bacterium]